MDDEWKGGGEGEEMWMNGEERANGEGERKWGREGGDGTIGLVLEVELGPRTGDGETWLL